MLLGYDIICLNEIRTSLTVSFPGYVSYRSSMRGPAHRGGTIVFLKNAMNNAVIRVDTSIEDQIWIQFSFAPKIMFGFCYVPPFDSQYYSHVSFSFIQEKLKSGCLVDKFILVGDMNARFGEYVKEMIHSMELPNGSLYSYPLIPDPVYYPNENAYILSSICIECNLLVLNNLKVNNHHFISDKTFRKGREWISELDTFIVSENMLEYITDFHVVRDDSLPSDHAPISMTLGISFIDVEDLEYRAKQLGAHASLQETMTKVALRPINMKMIDEQLFLSQLSGIELPVIDLGLNFNMDINVEQVTGILYQCIENAKYNSNEMSFGNNNNSVHLEDRWNRLLLDKDDARIWKAVDWKGNYCISENRQINKPTDEEFKHFHESWSRDHTDFQFNDVGNITIPILDNPITENEVLQEAKRMNSNKACGLDGVTPGIFKLLPGPWLLLLASLLSNLFLAAQYPVSWSKAKFFTIFKKGDRLNPGNYRGISVINSIAKLYDMILCSRLKSWFKPYREQAGSQEKRSCIEHIVCLRLLCDLARRKKLKLFVLFVDFSKAYDMVHRPMLFRVLKRLGCGVVMLSALVAMYSITQSVLGSALITTTLGVRQGSPTSCLLFLIYVNDLIKMVKEGMGIDGFLIWLHILVLMDDTVLLATTRGNMIKKVQILKNYCSEYGMKVNESKTKFFVLNGTNDDEDPLYVGDLIIEKCDRYIYLGSPFTSDGSVSSAVKAHALLKMPHVLKFVAFIRKNNDIPFIVKKRVFDAALSSSLLYGCESWFTADLKPLNKLYNWCLKEMLGVRKTTCNDVCYVESGYPSLPHLIKFKQHKFFKNIWNERSNFDDDPLAFAIKKVVETNISTSKLIREFITRELITLERHRQSMINDIQMSTSSRRQGYKIMNPNFSVNNVYSNRHSVNEVHRISYTRFRLSSHSLVCEMGRWNKQGRGRLLPEDRICQCGAVQSEQHVVEQCPITDHLRQSYGFGTINDLFSDQFPANTMCEIIHKILSVYY